MPAPARSRQNAEKKDLRLELANRLIEQIESGTARWQKPWEAGEVLPPINVVTGKRYNGVNFQNLLMFSPDPSDPRWCTYKQAQEQGWQVRGGEHGTPLEKWSEYEHKRTEEEIVAIRAQAGPNAEIDPTERRLGVKHYTVFHASQIDGIPPLERKPRDQELEGRPDLRLDGLARNLGVELRRGGDRAFYRSSDDRVQMPLADDFQRAVEHDSTFLHELSHATGHSSRLKRELGNAFGSQKYAIEELRAEMSSAMTAAALGLGFDPSAQDREEGREIGNAAAYLASWLKALPGKERKQAIIGAIKDAQAISDYLIERVPEMEVAAPEVQGPEEAAVLHSVEAARGRLVRDIPEEVTPFLGSQQAMVTRDLLRNSEEKVFFCEKIQELQGIIQAMPATYDTDGKPDVGKPVGLRYFGPNGSQWFIIEKDRGDPANEGPGIPLQTQAFGLADLGQGYPELGYINIEEITRAGAELDYHFEPTNLLEIKKAHYPDLVRGKDAPDLPDPSPSNPLDPGLIAHLQERALIRDASHPDWSGLGDNVANAEAFVQRAAMRDPERAQRWARELRERTPEYSEAAGLHGERLLAIANDMESAAHRVAHPEVGDPVRFEPNDPDTLKGQPFSGRVIAALETSGGDIRYHLRAESGPEKDIEARVYGKDGKFRLIDLEQAVGFDRALPERQRGDSPEAPSQKNAYEMKLAAKRERFRALAEKARLQAQARLESARRMADIIPFGQPIMTGHHSEKRDRRFREKIHQAFGKGFGLLDKSEYYQRRADGVNPYAISSDDPDAIRKLKERLEILKMNQARMKVANAVIRKFDTPEDRKAGLERIGFTAQQAEKILTPDITGTVGFASYSLSNNNANIRRIEDRMKTLEKAATLKDRETQYAWGTVHENRDANRIQFLFPGKPDEDTRKLMKSEGFRWAPSEGAWQRQWTGNAVYSARMVIKALNARHGVEKGPAAPEPVAAEPEVSPREKAPQAFVAFHERVPAAVDALIEQEQARDREIRAREDALRSAYADLRVLQVRITDKQGKAQVVNGQEYLEKKLQAGLGRIGTERAGAVTKRVLEGPDGSVSRVNDPRFGEFCKQVEISAGGDLRRALQSLGVGVTVAAAAQEKAQEVEKAAPYRVPVRKAPDQDKGIGL